jgi:hypothetical protein
VVMYGDVWRWQGREEVRREGWKVDALKGLS